MSILSLNTADIFNAIGGGSPLSIINSVLHPSYVIRNHALGGGSAVEFDGMMSLDAGGRASITTAPVEGGTYQAINKVREPNRVRCSIIVKGLTGFNGNIPDIFSLSLTSQSSTLATLKEMIATAALYDIETPKETLESYDLISWDYSVTAVKGVSMLTVFLEFQEVIEQMNVILSGAQSNGQMTDNDKAGGVTGMASIAKDGNAKPSALDDLSKSWQNLKKATGQLTENIAGGITETFQSASQTVTQSAAEVAKSATDKATDVVKSISGSLS